MTKEEFAKLKNPSIFDRDYRGRPLLLNPEILANTKASIVNLIDDIAEALKPCNMTLSIHCLWESGGHVENSRHYQGIACDFHIVSQHTFYIEISTLENILGMMKVEHAVGLGLYPEWNNQGFHLDTRGVKARWGYVGAESTAYDLARRIAERQR
jgi:hypothetical protein